MATIHWLQHVPFEGLGSMEEWLIQEGHDLFCSRLWMDDPLPPPYSFSALIVMGGPMGVYDHEEYPWLAQEKEFLARVVERGIPILGICLGAQLLADVLGAEVVPNAEKEIGWFPVKATNDIPEGLATVLPKEMTVFHWHGDTFSLPEGAVHLYRSAVCENQAFFYNNHVLGLQFHLETTRNGAASLIDNCRAELVQASWIMAEQEMLKCDKNFCKINTCMHHLLQQFFPFQEGSITGDLS